MYICTCDGVCVDMYMCIVSRKYIRAHIAFLYVMTMYSTVRIPLVSNCAI